VQLLWPDPEPAPALFHDMNPQKNRRVIRTMAGYAADRPGGNRISEDVAEVSPKILPGSGTPL
jgi:hypothetical protein